MYSQRTDQALHEFKRMYDGRSEFDRNAFRDWLQAISGLTDALNEGLIGAPSLGLQVEIADQSHDDEFYMGYGSLPPDLLLKAIKAWESGVAFTPSAWNLD